jgi:hypothetical protein
MNAHILHDADIAARLKRLDTRADDASASPGFDYDSMLERRGRQQAGARRRLNAARGVAGALVVALIGASVWRFEQPTEAPVAIADGAPADSRGSEPRIVRADTYMAVAALEDHIASVDDALTVARTYAPRGAEVERLERARAELLDSYSQVRYAQMVSATY